MGGKVGATGTYKRTPEMIENADHIKWFADHPELRFDVANGRTLCVPCHKIRTKEGRKARA